MICRLFEFATDNGFSHKEKMHVPDCEFYKDSKCSICYDLNILLTHEKYSWNLSRKLKFDKPFSGFPKDSFKEVICALKLIHPVYETIWIVQKKFMDGVNYTITSGSKVLTTMTVKEVNQLLKSDYNYTGKDIHEGDF